MTIYWPGMTKWRKTDRESIQKEVEECYEALLQCPRCRGESKLRVVRGNTKDPRLALQQLGSVVTCDHCKDWTVRITAEGRQTFGKYIER
jgi:hypothetical protein